MDILGNVPFSRGLIAHGTQNIYIGKRKSANQLVCPYHKTVVPQESVGVWQRMEKDSGSCCLRTTGGSLEGLGSGGLWEVLGLQGWRISKEREGLT